MSAQEPRSFLSTDRYTSAEQFDREKRTVFRRTWLAVGRDADIARPGDCLTVDELGQSLILARGADGLVRAFHNSCRHRGTRILCGRHHVRTLTCPYHGWEYGLDGALCRVPDVSGFKDLDQATHGLIQIRADSCAGFLWVSFDDDAPSLREYLGPVAEQLEPYRLEEMKPIRRVSSTLPCNWKAFLDNNLEQYHVASVHPMLWAALSPQPPVFRDLGIHHLYSLSVANYGWREVLDRLTSPPDLNVHPDQKRLYQRYFVFPNTVISALPYQLTVFRVFPLTPDSCRFHYEFHVRRHASALARLRGRLTQLASIRIVNQDNAILGLLQQGVATGEARPIRLHREEAALDHFHGVIDQYLAGS